MDGPLQDTGQTRVTAPTSTRSRPGMQYRKSYATSSTPSTRAAGQSRPRCGKCCVRAGGKGLPHSQLRAHRALNPHSKLEPLECIASSKGNLEHQSEGLFQLCRGRNRGRALSNRTKPSTSSAPGQRPHLPVGLDTAPQQSRVF